jgi:hypothetical protein
MTLKVWSNSPRIATCEARVFSGRVKSVIATLLTRIEPRPRNTAGRHKGLLGGIHLYEAII